MKIIQSYNNFINEDTIKHLADSFSRYINSSTYNSRIIKNFMLEFLPNSYKTHENARKIYITHFEGNNIEYYDPEETINFISNEDELEFNINLLEFKYLSYKITQIVLNNHQDKEVGKLLVDSEVLDKEISNLDNYGKVTLIP